MTATIHKGLIAGLSDFVAAQAGLHFPPSSWRDLERGVSAAAAEAGTQDVEAYIRKVLTAPDNAEQFQTLVRHLTVGETYFFREKPALDALEGQVLPQLITARRATTKRLRIWSAACCTGEEPYTIAMILSRLLPDWKEWDITILGTDINTHFLKLAVAGVYREWSFRTTPAWIRERYFTATGDGSALNPEIKHMVTFAPLNLAVGDYPSQATNTADMDIIFCRNALMYFTPECAARVIGKLHSSLSKGGWLIVNPTEASPHLFQAYEMVVRPDVLLYRKGEHSSASPKSADASRHILSSPLPHIPTPVPPGPPLPAAVKHQSQTQNTQHPQRRETQGVISIESTYALYAEGNHTEAREKLLALVEQGTAEPRVFALLARLEADRRQLAEALEWCDRAAATDRLNPAYWYLRATILQEQGAVDEAVKVLKRVLYLDPNFLLAHFVLGNLALQHGRKAETAKHFNRVRALLSSYKEDETISEVDDLTAGQLSTIIAAMPD